MILPAGAGPPLAALAPLFTHPTYARFLAPTGAAILTTGRRTVANARRTAGGLAPGHRTSGRRVPSAAGWSGPERGRALARFVLDHVVPDGTAHLVGGDTGDAHPGPKVDGKARHRDPTRSTHPYTTWGYGHRWVVPAVPVRFPLATRPWALPVRVDLYRSPERDRTEGRRDKTPARLPCRRVRVLLIRFPNRAFARAGGAGYGTRAVARFCHRHRARRTPVGELCPDADLYLPPPPSAGAGRPRVKGDRRPKPRQAVAGRGPRSRPRPTVGWYGGGSRAVAAVTGTGHRYQSGRGPAPVRGVFVEDRSGARRGEYLFTTDPDRTPSAAIGLSTARWDIGTTVQECRSGSGPGTTRGWCRRTVLRAARCRFGRYAVVAVRFHAPPAERRSGPGAWPGRAGVTFADALTAARRWVWTEGVIPPAGAGAAIQRLPPAVGELLLAGLAPAP